MGKGRDKRKRNKRKIEKQKKVKNVIKDRVS